jgi:hypothetical protein
MAAIMLSPPPALTGTPTGSPSESAADWRTPPTTDSDGTMLGRLADQSRSASMASSTGRLYWRSHTSK